MTERDFEVQELRRKVTALEKKSRRWNRSTSSTWPKSPISGGPLIS